MNRELTLAGAPKCRAVVVQTSAMKAAMTALRPQIEQKVHVVPGGFSRHLCSADCFYSELPHAPAATGPFLIYVAHPSEHKNHETLLKAMTYVIGEYPSASLLLTVDPGKAENSRYTTLVARMRKTVDELKLTKHVHYLGILTPSQVACALKHSHLSVFPSLSESFGLPLVESLAAGCPLAVSDLPFAREIAGDAAEYFDPLCARSIAASILRLLGSESLRLRLAAAAKARSYRFCYEDIAQKLCAILEGSCERAC